MSELVESADISIEAKVALCEGDNPIVGDDIHKKKQEVSVEDYDEEEMNIDGGDDSDVEEGVPSKQVSALLVEIDPASGDVIESQPLPQLTATFDEGSHTTKCKVSGNDSEQNLYDEKEDSGDEPPDGSSSRKKIARPKTACGYPIPFPLKGMMMKMSTGFIKHWNKRYFQLERGALIYFEPVHWYLKGQYDLVGLEVSVTCENCGDLLIRLVAPDRPEVLLQAEDAEMKEKWISALKEHIAFANYVSIQVKKTMEMPTSDAGTMRKTTSRNRTRTVIPPTMVHGWLYKKGQLFPTIRRRYFILQEGMISYYKQDLRDLLPTHPIDGMNFPTTDTRKHVDAIKPTEEQQRQIPRPLGKFSVYDYQLYSDSSDGRIELLLMPGLQSRSKRKLFVYCDNYADRDRWVKALNEHSCFVANVA